MLRVSCMLEYQNDETSHHFLMQTLRLHNAHDPSPMPQYLVTHIPSICNTYSIHNPCILPAYFRHNSCTFHTQSKHLPGMPHIFLLFMHIHAYAMHMPCIRHAYAMHMPCLGRAQSMHMPQTVHAYAIPIHVYSLHIPCAFHAYSILIPSIFHA